MNKKVQTVQTYNSNAKKFAQKFDDIGARIRDIEKLFSLVKKVNPKVLEIGCANGRDAKEILTRTNDYLGIDISEELVKLAREKVPNARFEVADVTTFPFPDDLDIIFASASLLHIPNEELKDVMERAYKALNKGGVFLVSLKYAKEYKEVAQEDEFGTRMYYHYSLEDIEELAPNFTFVKNEIVEWLGEQWLEVILQKNHD